MEPPSPEQFAGASIPTPPIADDDGATSAELEAALAALTAGTGSGPAVLAALAASRVLVPVVAVLDETETGAHGLRQEKHSSMATVLIEAADGERALVAFSGTGPMTRWRPDARPVSLMAPIAARAALSEDAATLLVDVAGPHPFAVTGVELLLLAAVARPAGEPTDDPVLRAAVVRQLAATCWVEAASLLPGEDGTASLLVATGDASPDVADLVRRLAGDRVVRHLLPAGLRVRAVAPTALPDTPAPFFG